MKTIYDQFVRLDQGADLIAPDPFNRDAIRFLDKGCLAVQAPARIVGQQFMLDTPGTHPGSLWLEAWVPADSVINEPLSFSPIGGARPLASPPTITFRDCAFTSALPWAEGTLGMIAGIWVNGSAPTGMKAAPFHVVFDRCSFNMRSIVLFDGHPNSSGLERQVDVTFRNCEINCSLFWGSNPEPNDPNAAICKSSPGLLTVQDTQIRVARPTFGRDVSINCISCSDGIVQQRTRIEGWLNGVQATGLRALMSQSRGHNRSSVIGISGPFLLDGTLVENQAQPRSITPYAVYAEELNGRTLSDEDGLGSGWTHNTSETTPTRKSWYYVSRTGGA